MTRVGIDGPSAYLWEGPTSQSAPNREEGHYRFCNFLLIAIQMSVSSYFTLETHRYMQ